MITFRITRTCGNKTATFGKITVDDLPFKALTLEKRDPESFDYQQSSSQRSLSALPYGRYRVKLVGGPFTGFSLLIETHGIMQGAKFCADSNGDAVKLLTGHVCLGKSKNDDFSVLGAKEAQEVFGRFLESLNVEGKLLIGKYGMAELVIDKAPYFQYSDISKDDVEREMRMREAELLDFDVIEDCPQGREEV